MFFFRVSLFPVKLVQLVLKHKTVIHNPSDGGGSHDIVLSESGNRSGFISYEPGYFVQNISFYF